jgi:hypothetical protein
MAKLTPSTARTSPFLGVEIDPQVFDFQDVVVWLHPVTWCCIRIGGITQAVAHEVETHDGEDDRTDRQQQPGVALDHLHAHAVLQHDAPTDRRGLEAEPRKLRLVSPRIMPGMVMVSETMMWLVKPGTSAGKGPGVAGAEQARGHGVVLLAQGEDLAATTRAIPVQPMSDRITVIPR